MNSQLHLVKNSTHEEYRTNVQERCSVEHLPTTKKLLFSLIMINLLSSITMRNDKNRDSTLKKGDEFYQRF